MLELAKGWFPKLGLFEAQSDPDKELQRIAWLHLISGLCGALIAALGNIDVLQGISGNNTIPLTGSPNLHRWTSCVTAGLMASAGSAFWNHVLDFVKAAKVQREQAAIATVATNRARNLLDVSHPESFALATTGTHTAAFAVSQLTAPIQAKGCAISLDPGTNNWVAKTGPISLKLGNITGAVALVKQNCFVTFGCNSESPKITVNATADTLTFTADKPGCYAITISSFVGKNASADLVEDCGAGLPILHIQAPDGAIQTITIQVS
jgi:hypothetical protein